MNLLALVLPGHHATILEEHDMRNFQIICAFIVSSLLPAIPAYSQTVSQMYGDTITKQIPTFFVRGDYEWLTLDSDTVDSNGSASATSVQMGTYAGESRELGLFVNAQDKKVDFRESYSKFDSQAYDITMQYRLWFLYPSVSLHWNEMQIDKDGANIVELQARGTGAGIDFKVPLTRKIIIEGGIHQTLNLTTNDLQGRDIKLNSTQEFEVAANLDLIPFYLDLLVGYKQKRLSLSIDDADYEEFNSSPFAGIQTGIYF